MNIRRLSGRLRWFLLALGCFGFSMAGNAGQFSPPVNYATGSNPFAVVAGDFNGDGIPDLAAANAAQGLPAGTISILLGKGDGSFRTAVDYGSGGPEPSGLAVGDFNNDGRLDLAVANYAGGGGTPNVSILLGNGDGTFQAAVSYTAGSGDRAVAAADFNRDGKLDLAVATNDSHGLSILLGNGDGTFRPAISYTTGFAASSVVVADFNRDRKLDLAVTNENSNDLSILLGRGDGSFQAAVNYAAGSGPDSVATGDFNGDGKVDLAVTNAASSFGSTVSVLLGKGDGTFAMPVSYAAGPEPYSVAVADFNQDGKPDLAVADSSFPQSTSVSLLLGNGDGTFQAPLEYNVGVGPVSVIADDFNRDGLPDLATANIGSGNVSVLLNSGPGCVSPPEIVDVRADPDELRPEDGKWVNVAVDYKAISRCGGASACSVTVTDNDPAKKTDWTIVDAHHVRLRARQNRCESGRNSEAGRPQQAPQEDACPRRVYQLAIRCSDLSGNLASAVTAVTVCGDDGPEHSDR